MVSEFSSYPAPSDPAPSGPAPSDLSEPAVDVQAFGGSTAGSVPNDPNSEST